jgi:DNA-binding NtrC family response regulator
MQLALALDRLRRLSDLASEHSFNRDAVDSIANAAYVYHLRGDWESGAEALDAVLSSSAATAAAQIGTIESRARSCLALGQLDQCSSFLSRLAEAAGREPRLRLSHPIRWSHIDAARLAAKLGNHERALAHLFDAEADQAQTIDVQFTATLHASAAQFAARLGNGPLASRQLVAAGLKGASGHCEVQGQYYYAAAVAIDSFDPVLSTHLRDRARRLWKHQGIVSLEREMEDVPPPAPKWRGARRSAPVAINALGSALDLAHSPRLLGDELVRALKRLGVTAALVPGDAPVKDGEVRLPIGSDGGRALTVVCQLPDRPDTAVLMQDVLRVGRAATELEAYREDERKRTALWPEDPIEEQMGALFVSQEMRDLLATVRRVAETNVPVLITGETGTGKEVVAKIIHAYSERAKTPLLAFNCASMPRDMLDSQLFGHRRGAFTGAIEHFPGVIRSADRGTLLLDEIGDMPLDVQPKLLRFLESGEVHPIGEVRPTHVDVRVMAATNAKLSSLVAQGLFREDLFYRLNIVELVVPPLRERRVDVPVLANHYLKKHAEEYHKGPLRIAEDAMEHLLLYQWPGNVRQLANEMRRAAAVAERGGVIMAEHLSADIVAARRTIPSAERPPDAREVTVRLDQPLAAALEYVERAMIRHAMTKCNGHVEDSATLLGMSRKGLYLKRQRYQLDPPGTPRAASV